MILVKGIDKVMKEAFHALVLAGVVEVVGGNVFAKELDAAMN